MKRATEKGDAKIPPPMPRGGEIFGAWYDHKAANNAVNFFPTYIRHTEAEWYGKPFILSPWQEIIVRTAFGWKRADGTRLIRQVYIEIPRKNGKTEFAAGLALLIMLGDSEFGGQGYAMACDEQQARIVFNKAGTMVGLSPALAKEIEVFKTSIFCATLQAGFLPLSSKAATKHGFSPSFAVADELHEWPDGELHDVVHKGTGARRQPLEILITTSGEPGIGYGWELHEYATEILSGKNTNPSFYPVIFAAAPSDDWRSPETWRKANPNLNISIKEDYLAGEVALAEGNTRRIADFKRFHLNIWNGEAVGGIDMAQWDACGGRPVRLEDLKGRTCWAALDLASTTDMCALCLVAPRIDGVDGFDVWWHFWMPKENIGARMHKDRVSFDRWIAAGYITATEGNVVDYDAIRAKISGGVPHDAMTGPVVAHVVKISELAIDRWNATQLMTQLLADGINVVEFGQGYRSMTAPSKEFERLLGKGLLNHGNNPVAHWMATCTTFITDGSENIKPAKPDRRRTSKRIDGIVTLIMALARTLAAPEPEQVPGIIIL
ncbi:terminase large subunit [Propionivibrio sp.]|uniref:terminase large subunit n=1 Tax=Propionivibrio sp. TaxID=2212460 RepID=UPI00260CFF98|nr:terminase large subunit [Propionivibrio sp.]